MKRSIFVAFFRFALVPGFKIEPEGNDVSKCPKDARESKGRKAAKESHRHRIRAGRGVPSGPVGVDGEAIQGEGI